MTTEDRMVLAIDAVKAVEITEASDEAISLFISHLYEAAKRISKEQAARIQARFNTAMDHGVYEEELATIRGEK